MKRLFHYLLWKVIGPYGKKKWPKFKDMPSAGIWADRTEVEYLNESSSSYQEVEDENTT